MSTRMKMSLSTHASPSYPQELSTGPPVSRETRRRTLAHPVDRAVDDPHDIGVVSRETAAVPESTGATHRLWIVAVTHVCRRARSPETAPAAPSWQRPRTRARNQLVATSTWSWRPVGRRRWSPNAPALQSQSPSGLETGTEFHAGSRSAWLPKLLQLASPHEKKIHTRAAVLHRPTGAPCPGRIPAACSLNHG
jgi:hypothetical protein